MWFLFIGGQSGLGDPSLQAAYNGEQYPDCPQHVPNWSVNQFWSHRHGNSSKWLTIPPTVGSLFHVPK